MEKLKGQTNFSKEKKKAWIQTLVNDSCGSVSNGRKDRTVTKLERKRREVECGTRLNWMGY